MTTILEAAMTAAKPEFPRGWHIDPRTGWPWPGIIVRNEDDRDIAEARHRVAIHIRVLRHDIAALRADPAYDRPLMDLLRTERLGAMRREIRAFRDIFRSAPRSALRPDLAGLPGEVAESRDGVAASSRASHGALGPGGGAHAVTRATSAGSASSPPGAAGPRAAI